MKISINWLRRYVDVPWDAEEMARRLTLAGLEVESVEPFGVAPEGVRIARVVEAEQHPNADRLRVAQVDIGGGERMRVVCGASNCRAGIRVAYAELGATLPNGTTIQQAEIRGVESFGMLCSEDELGLSDERAPGIMELAEDAPVGQPLTSWVDLADTVLDIGITPDRGDCLSHLGVAREIAALAGVPLNRPETTIEAAGDDAPVPVEIAAPELCARYVGRLVRGLGVAPAPLWMRRLLEACGVRSINNLVDVTNFVMLEYGQPLHAFDLRRLRGPAIRVRRAADGEQMSTLDEIERSFTADDLLICDAEGAVAVAGVMGGADTEIADDTTDVFLESAWFEPSSVRRTSRRLGLKTESSYRFERDIDPEMTREAADRALRLMCELSAPGTRPIVARAVTDARPRVVARPTVHYRPVQADLLLGTAVDPATQRIALSRLGFVVEEQNGGWSVRTPSWRGDVGEAADLIEEVARFIGYDAIPTPPARVSSGGDPIHDRTPRARRLGALRDLLNARGLHQAINFTFVAAELLARFDRRAPLRLTNPISEDQAVLRTSLAPGLVANAAHNLRHGAGSVALFEHGRAILPGDDGALPEEVERLGLVLSGTAARHWSGGGRDFDFFDLKGLVEDLCAGTGVSGALAFEPAVDVEWLHPGAAATVRIGDRAIGLVGALHPRLLRAMDIVRPVLVAELDLDPLVEPGAAIRFEDFGRFPAVHRDLALLLPVSTPAETVVGTARGLGLDVVDKVEIFDVYEGKGVPDGRRSLGITVTYRSSERTLTDDEVSRATDALVTHLRDTLGAELR